MYLDDRVSKGDVKVACHLVNGHEAVEVASLALLHRPYRDRDFEAGLALGGGAPVRGREGRGGDLRRGCRCLTSA